MSESIFRTTYQGAGDRLDKYLTACLPEHSRSRIQALIREGRATVDGEVITKTGTTLEDGQSITLELPPPQPTDLIPEAIPLDVIFENDDLLVINKPAGMVVHPAAGHWSGTLVHAALAHAPGLEGVGGEQRPGIVHRLDKDTSGLILVAKTDRAHRYLVDQFRLRRVQKTYLALVDGHLPTPEGRVEAPIGRDESHRRKMAITSLDKGREAITEYHVAEVFPEHTLVEAHPLTGRTHQIRLHLTFLGCPIVGDTLYGHRHASLPVPRQFLHAAHLRLVLPGETQERHFEAALPADLATALDDLRNNH